MHHANDAHTLDLTEHDRQLLLNAQYCREHERRFEINRIATILLVIGGVGVAGLSLLELMLGPATLNSFYKALIGLWMIAFALAMHALMKERRHSLALIDKLANDIPSALSASSAVNAESSLEKNA